jgi:hypothetical protein
VYDGTTTGGTILATNQQVLTIANLVANSTIQVGNVPPATSTTGTLWYDSVGGRTYIRYDHAWVDASPAITDLSILDITANVAQLQGILEEFGQEIGVAFGTIQGNIDTLTSNAQTLNTNFNSYTTYANANAAAVTTRAQTLSANLGAFQTYANLNINNLLYEDSRLSANIGAYQIYANANARALAYQIKSLDANVGRILLYETSTGSGANVTVDTQPPIVNSTGSLWWDTEDGRLYLRYNNTWVDASPTINAAIASTTAAVAGTPTWNVPTDCVHLDLSKQVQYLDSTSANIGYYLADGVEGQVMHFVAKASTDMHSIVVFCAHIRYRNSTAVIAPGDWLPFYDGIASGGRTMGTGIFIDGAWSFDGGDID